MSNRVKLLISFFSTILFVSFICTPSSMNAEKEGENKLVYIIPIENEVERGLEAFLVRSTNEAIEAGANHIIFEIDTPGGRVDSAGQIGKLLQGLEIPTSAFIVNEALSAGSYIALNSDTIYMKPNATMGASGVITGDGNAADEKAQSAWIAAMKSAAESKGRDPQYAIAMADPSIDLPELGAPEGKFLTLTPTDAVEVGYAEGIVQNRVELLYELNLTNATIVETETSFAEEVARFVTSPFVIPILLSVASLGLIVELYSPGFGVAGTMGLIALFLFFYGHVIAGLAGMEAIVLLVLGIILIIVEFFVAGGIIGLLGVGAILASLFMSGYDIGHMSLSISIAFIVAVVAAVILYKWIGAERGIFKKLILRDRTTTELGYISSQERKELIGKEGISVTPLRPAGTAIIANERLDVVSDGSFIEKDKQLTVIQVEGIKIVVREIKDH
ncbi:membrane-bound serine protease (ClpP class) [Pseudogracilibacillus auburnensis]|uniref:Membrane-bound serine protease (ClpP class) n=1 Tax=Pseudogracilibacillus auburnensis TaxID=1494959 RepID=A0A2V3VY58_9BACI|nr:membrane-bound serine protease (ClpP class) [Pseudogracilibacillus auburnensis]